ncbi:MAG TPA: efflux RND transporter permease subunit [Chthoniobacterales bacterium]|nr:efflux RND transporter permease subunit [Chthoniobacterales bacterium]
MNRWTRKHYRSVLFCFAALGIAGIMSSLNIPVALFPRVSFPRIKIDLDAGDRPAERMELEVTRPVEEFIHSVPGVRSVRSATSRGTASISVFFDWGEDMVSALLQVQARINQTISSLPSGTTFTVERMDPTVFPVICYSLTSPTRSLVELRDLAYYTFRPPLSTVPGVAKVQVLGGRQEEYRVVVDQGKALTRGLTLSDIANAVAASNVLVAVGKLEEYDKLFLIISDTRLGTVEDVKRTVVRANGTGVVQLQDVATVEDTTAPQWIRVTADGRDAVLFQIYQQPGGNTVRIAAAVKQKLAEMQKLVPPGVKIASWYDQSDLILASAESTRDAILIGVVLASLILLLFLRSFKVMLVAMLSVPATLAITVLILSLLGMSFNIMTLGGIAAAVGLIVDDSIVMVEHMVRRLREDPQGDHTGRLQDAAAEFTRPLAGSSAATIVIFVPLAFLSGVTGAFFKALSLTMAAGLVISFLIAWLVVPILCVRWLSHRDALIHEHGRITEWIHERYRWLLAGLLEHPWRVSLIILPLLVAGWFATQSVGSGFLPSMDEGGFIIDYKSPPGTSLAETDRLLRQVEQLIRETPETQTYSRRTGLGLGEPSDEPNRGDFFVRLKPPPRRRIEQVMEDVRSKIEAEVPGLEIETAQLMEDLIGDLTSVPQPVEIKLFSEDQKLLAKLTPQVVDAISKVPGLVEIKNGIIPAGDALTIQVDRSKAALEGVDPDTISKTLESYIAGDVTTSIQHGPKLIGVRVRLPDSQHETRQQMRDLLLRAPDGHLFPLSRVATITAETGQPEISREDLRRMATVTARIEGRDLGSTVKDVKKILDRSGILPKEVPYVLGGLYEQQQLAFQSLTTILIAAIVLVFALLLFLYENFRVVVAMLFTTLLAIAGVYIGLLLTGTEFNITSRMGMTMIVGIVTEVAIFYYSEYRALPPDSQPYIQAGINRMRPIVMTTFAAILALLPLAFGFGQGAAMLKPLAIAIISGLIFQLPLVLVVLPALLALFRDHRVDEDWQK